MSPVRYGSRMGDVPLSGLLARALGDLTAELALAGAGHEGMPSAPMWFGFLRTVRPSGVGGKELPALTRLSKRAVRQLVGATTRGGWVDGLSGTGVHTMFGPTDAGRAAADFWMAISDSTERHWCSRVGADRAALKAALAAVVGQLDLEWPHYPISYGVGDLRVTGGRFRPARAGPPRIPARGQDWVPVIRGRDDTVSALTLTALLSQLLIAFTAEYEEASGVLSLVEAEGLVRGFGSDNAAPMKDLPPVLGVNGSGRSGLERHRIVSVRSSLTDTPIKIAHLTARGQSVRNRYVGLVATIESDWQTRFGSTITAVRRQLGAILPAFDPALVDALIASHVRS